MTTAAARRSAQAHPYFADLYTAWSDHEPLTVGFQTEAEARSFVAGRPEPLVDLVRRGDGVIAVRRAVIHPATDPRAFTARDDFEVPS